MYAGLRLTWLTGAGGRLEPDEFLGVDELLPPWRTQVKTMTPKISETTKSVPHPIDFVSLDAAIGYYFLPNVKGHQPLTGGEASTAGWVGIVIVIISGTRGWSGVLCSALLC